MRVDIKKMKITLAEKFESPQNEKKIRRKSVKHVKHNILHLKPPKIDKITPIGAVLGFVKHVKQFSRSAVGYNRATCTTVLRVAEALFFAAENWRYAQHK